MKGQFLLRQWRWPLVFAALFLLALRISDGLVQDWGRLANGMDNLRAFSESRCGQRTGACCSLRPTRSAS